MSLYSNELDKQYILDDFENKLKRKSGSWSLKLLKSDEDKRARREVANNNERRRMQSINAGFENLRKLLPYCPENDKISKASILQTTAKYILELKTKINCLENDLLRVNPETNKCTSLDSSNCTNDLSSEFVSTGNILQDKSEKSSSYQSDLGSSTSSLITDNLSSSTISLKSYTDSDPVVSVNELCLGGPDSPGDSCQPQSTLEHLLAAVAQVERQEAMQVNDSISELGRSPPPSPHNPVMKPTISPYADKIIQDAANMHRPYFNHGLTGSNPSLLIGLDNSSTEMQQYRSSKIAIPHKYLHRPGVVLSRSSNL